MRGVLILFALLTLISLTFVSATIEITQPFEIYNFGDEIYTTVTLNPTTVSGNFEINVVCSNQSANVYKIAPADGAFSPNQIQKVNHKIVLTKEFIGNLSGNCYIEALLGKEVIDSSQFMLTGDINLAVKTDKSSYNPGEEVDWTVEAVKANTVNLNGAVEVSGNQSFNKAVVNGKASGSFNINSDAKAGKYQLDFFVYDSDANGILNQKTMSVYYEVNQVPTSLNIAMVGYEATPLQDFSFSADLFDQSGDRMNRSLNAVYASVEGEETSLKIDSGTMVNLNFPQNATPGNYTLTVSQGSVKDVEEFFIKAVPNVSVEFLEGAPVVIVKNIGNVFYSNNLSLRIGNIVKEVLVELKVGDEKRYNLGAPNGLYDVIATIDGMNIQKQLSLTGNAVSVNGSNGFGMWENQVFVWTFIAIILVLAGIVIFFRFRGRRTYDAVQRSEKRVAIAAKEKHEPLEDVSKRVYEKKQFVDLAKPLVDEAQSVLTTKGTKSYASVIALNVKNYNGLNGHARNEINEAIIDAKSKSGVIEHKGNHVLIIFSPLITKTVGDNEVLAVKCAWKIKERLDSYNKRFTGKIDYNIGVNAGQMVAALVGGKLNYTSLGNGVLLAKRISDLDSGKILVSSMVRSKLMRELKVNKINHTIGNVDIFDVYRIADMEANEQKLKDLLKRTSWS